MRENEGFHFRHKGILSVWVEEGHNAMGKGRPIEGVNLQAASGLWRVKMSPNRYQCVFPDVSSYRCFILYTGNSEQNLEKLPPRIALQLNPFDDNMISDFCIITICSDGKPVIAYELHLSTYGVQENKVFAFPLLNPYSKEGEEISKKYDLLYNTLLYDLQQGVLAEGKS